eukprot:scaffold176028_cov51-Attheya_sp.AAC.1
MNETGCEFESKHDNIINANSITDEMAKTEEDPTTAGSTTSSTHKTNTARSRKLVLTFPQK